MIHDPGAAVAVIEARSSMPFAWGSDANDCISFYSAVCRAYCGVDPISGLYWSSEAEARDVIAGLGGFVAAIGSRMKPVAPGFAKRFDAALVEMAEGPVLMVVEGDMLVGPGHHRQIRLPRRRMRLAWTP